MFLDNKIYGWKKREYIKREYSKFAKKSQFPKVNSFSRKRMVIGIKKP